jgi:hypothetical protein
MRGGSLTRAVGRATRDATVTTSISESREALAELSQRLEALGRYL